MDSNEIINTLSVYLDWAKGICADKNIRMDKKVTQIVDGKLFCISSSDGDLYLKKMNNFINDELKFTLKLMELGIITMPALVGYDHDMMICLMRDMGGSNLSVLPQLGACPKEVHLSFDNNIKAIAAHCLEQNNRYTTASTYLKRFIANDFS